jgi:hypothetical protein
MSPPWIRSAWWDGFWILSGIPVAALLLLASASVPQPVLILLAIVLLQTGHLISPMMLAWSHAGFRQVMSRQRLKYIVVPAAILLATTGLGVVTSFVSTDLHPDIGLSVKIRNPADYKNPFILMLVLYTAWNAYHFAMQNFGVLSIYRNKGRTYGPGQRRVDMIFCLTVTGLSTLLTFARELSLEHDAVRDGYVFIAAVAIVVMLWRETLAGILCLPRVLFIVTDALGLVLVFWQGLTGFAIYSVNHWLVAIGLASHVHAGHRGRSPALFAGLLMVSGTILFALLFLTFPRFAFRVTMPAIGLRVGIGFVHFLYDRYIWKLSDPQVRETIGRDLLSSGRLEMLTSAP